MERIELQDIQGIILHGYGDLSAACFVFLHIEDARAARGWLRGLLASGPDERTASGGGGNITLSYGEPGTRCVNVAFTHAGLRHLGLNEDTLGEFSDEFRIGMPAYANALGDHAASAPTEWDWGASTDDQERATADRVDVLLLLYASDAAARAAQYAEHRQRFEGAGLRELRHFDTRRLPGRKEHFGFRDGIAQPRIRNRNPDDERVGLLKPAPVGQEANVVAPGEFLLGYPNEQDNLPPSPKVDPRLDRQGILGNRAGNPTHDFGRNGSYLVFRQLEQKVRAFWNFVARIHQEPEEQLWFASKLMGRWPNGVPVVKAPDQPPDLSTNSDDDDFLYQNGDAAGHRCPIGSHIRRLNPRDALERDPVLSLKHANRRRIIRRGREYGEPVDASMDPARILEARCPDEGRGILFLCFNADIGAQFEFLQKSWVNNPKFQGLYDDQDPVIGNHDPSGTGQFTIQTEIGPLPVSGLERFVTVKGGAYLFMPSIGALRYLAALEE